MLTKATMSMALSMVSVNVFKTLLSLQSAPTRIKQVSKQGAVAERWAAPRLSLFDSLREGPLPECTPPKKKGYLLKWDLDITRFHTEDLVRPSQRPASFVQWEQLLAKWLQDSTNPSCLVQQLAHSKLLTSITMPLVAAKGWASMTC